MTTYFKATFSDGGVASRSTTSRAYTHAWRAGKCTAGFSGSAQLAHKAASSSGLPNAEVAPCVEIDAKEYRALKKADAAAHRARMANLYEEVK